MKFEIGTKTFYTKGEAQEYLRTHFRNLWKTQASLTTEDKLILTQLLENRNDGIHPVKDITDFRIITSKFNKFEVQYTLNTIGEWHTFSISRCIVGFSKNDCSKVYKLLRDSIYDQIRKFRDTNPVQKCLICGSIDKIEVDHIKPTFKTIVDDFNKLAYEAHIWYGLEEQPTHDVIEMFKEYHQENATYRYLCQTHNLSEYHKSGPKKTMSSVEYKERNIKNATDRYHAKKLLRTQEIIKPIIQ